jgi:hypothetical protein
MRCSIPILPVVQSVPPTQLMYSNANHSVSCQFLFLAASDSEGTRTLPHFVPDPRALGLLSRFSTEDMLTVKRLILLALTKGLQLAALVR